MDNRIITIPRIIFLSIFTFINANVAAKITWQKHSALLIDYLLGAVVAWAILTAGYTIGDSYGKTLLKKQRSLSEVLSFIEVFGFVIALIIETGFIGFIFVYHL